ncbi:MAG: ABC transporter ATP-binding protein [Phycisphaerae bacterium]
MTMAIHIKNLTKNFGSKPALRGVDLEIPVGATVGLLGANGAGKTTLIKCALGLLRPTSGECFLLGESAWSLSAAAKARLGYVPQVINLYPWMRVAELIQYIAAFYATWNAELADRLIKQWELPLGDRVRTLSVGQKQRLAILTAVAYQPDLLILDEPAASLDPGARRQFLQLLVELTEPQQRTVLFSTHITSDLERVADHVAIMKEGKIAWFGSLEALKERTHTSLEDAFLEIQQGVEHG